MNLNKNIAIGIGLGVIIAGYFLFFSGESKKKKVESKKLSALLGGGSASGVDESGFEKRRGYKNNDASLFDGDFMKSGVSYPEEELNSNASTEQGEIPINPQTGKPWEEDAMQQFEELRKQFPGNDLIPKRMSRMDKEKKAQLDARNNKAAVAVSSGTFTKDDLEIHFSNQKKVMEDRLQIIEYLIESQKEEGAEDKDGQFQKILNGTKDQMKQLEIQKEELAKKVSQ